MPKGWRVTTDNTASLWRACAFPFAAAVHREQRPGNALTPFSPPFRPPFSHANPRPTMALTPQDVSRIAHLARLELSSAEKAAMLAQINDFFGIVERMSAVDTSGVEPLYTPLSAVQEVGLRLRDDVVTETDQRAANQRSAPRVEDGLFLVPRVIE